MVGVFDRLDAVDVFALGGRRLSFFSWFFKILKQGVVSVISSVIRFFCRSLRLIINKQCDDPSGVTLLLEAENVFSIKRIIFACKLIVWMKLNALGKP